MFKSGIFPFQIQRMNAYFLISPPSLAITSLFLHKLQKDKICLKYKFVLWCIFNEPLEGVVQYHHD